MLHGGAIGVGYPRRRTKVVGVIPVAVLLVLHDLLPFVQILKRIFLRQRISVKAVHHLVEKFGGAFLMLANHIRIILKALVQVL